MSGLRNTPIYGRRRERLQVVGALPAADCFRDDVRRDQGMRSPHRYGPATHSLDHRDITAYEAEGLSKQLINTASKALFMTLVGSVSNVSKAQNLSTALAVASVMIAGEYFFRHYLLFWLPTLGTLVVNDMLALFLVYSLLAASIGALMHVSWPQELAAVGHALRVGLTSWDFTISLLALVLSVVALPIADRLLWGKLALPMFISSYRNPAVWWAGLAPLLKAVSLLLVNGFFVPIAEEYLWRGLVQARLISVFSPPFAIGVTAILFSFKHALVDASLGRFLTLIAFGVICGIVAQRSNWRSSAALHMFANTAFTAMGLSLGLE